MSDPTTVAVPLETLTRWAQLLAEHTVDAWALGLHRELVEALRDAYLAPRCVKCRETLPAPVGIDEERCVPCSDDWDAKEEQR